ncbi:MAG: right-handed parallel beta-helix repeat-containing protein [Armatimonadota bacterium]
MCRTSVATIAAAMAMSVVARAQIEPNEKAIADVAAGRIKEAKASWWGFDPQDSTQSLQAAINSGVAKLIVDDVGKPWIVEPMRLASDQTIVFEDGVEVLAKKGSFKGKGDCLFVASEKQNVTLTGYGATLRMRRSDYDGPEYEKAEWRHCLSIRSCSNVKVYGLTLAESGGDGIYLGTAKQWVTNKGIHIKDVVCDKNYRQGISVITAEDLLIENCVLRDTGGTPPQAGIDFEPNSSHERLVNCIMRDCLIQNNNGNGIVMYLLALNAESEPVSLRFENCRSIGDNGSARVSLGPSSEAAVGGSIEFVNCTFQDSKAAGIVVSKPAGRCPVRFLKCSVINPARDAANQTPIVLASRQGASDAVGGVEFADCRIRDPLKRNPMSYLNGGGVGLEDVTGRLILEEEGGERTVPLTEDVLGKWMPVIAWKPVPRLSLKDLALRPLAPDAPADSFAFGFAVVRGTGRFLLYAKAGDRVTFTVEHLQVGNYGGKPAPVVITSPSGEAAHRDTVPFKGRKEVAFTAPETGVYRITAEAAPNRLRIASSTHPINLNGEGGPVHLIYAAGDYYFWVPKGTREFAVRVAGEGGEAIRALLINPAGETVGEVDNLAQLHQFEITLPKPSAGEAWILRLAKPSAAVWEDHTVDLRGVPPLLAPSREALLVPEE